MAQTAQTLAPAPADAYLEIERLDLYLDVLAGRGVLSAEAHRRGRGLLVRSVQMLTRLIGRFARTCYAHRWGPWRSSPRARSRSRQS